MKELEIEEKLKKTEIDLTDFEARQNVDGFFNVLLKVVLRNPELRKKVFNENKDETKNV